MSNDKIRKISDLYLTKEDVSLFIHKDLVGCSVEHYNPENISDDFKFIIIPDLSSFNVEEFMDFIYEHCDTNSINYIVNFNDLINAKPSKSKIRLLAKYFGMLKPKMIEDPAAFEVNVKFNEGFVKSIGLNQIYSKLSKQNQRTMK